MRAVRVLLVDDHAALRGGVAAVLSCERDFRLVGEAGDGAQALELARELVPDLVLMDLSMPGMDGLEATRRIKAELPCVKIVVLTAADAGCSVFEAVRSGAHAYVSKNVQPAALVRTLRAVARGRAPISAAMAAQLVAGLAADSGSSSPGGALTSREHETLRLIAGSKGTPAVASALGMAEGAVANVLQNILEKLHLEHRVRSAASGLREEGGSRPATVARHS